MHQPQQTQQSLQQTHNQHAIHQMHQTLVNQHLGQQDHNQNNQLAHQQQLGHNPNQGFENYNGQPISQMGVNMHNNNLNQHHT